MKSVIASTGVFAVGVAGLQGANVTGLTPQEASKWWSVSASLRGFYDDNSLNASHDTKASLGVEFSPTFSVHLPMERTILSATYRYTLDYFEARPNHNMDQQHEFDTRLNHKFTERYTANFDDSFVSSN